MLQRSFESATRSSRSPQRQIRVRSCLSRRRSVGLPDGNSLRLGNVDALVLLQIVAFCGGHYLIAHDAAIANLYILTETANANAIEQYAYLRTVFTELLQAASAEQVATLLPVLRDRSDLANV